MAIEPDIEHSQFPQELPAREQSWKQRNCPNMRTCWQFSLSSYDPFRCPDSATRSRRIAMILIMALRMTISAFSILFAVVRGYIVEIVIYAILAALSTWFIAWCLARIGDAVGERRVFGRLIGRKHLDWFIYGCAIIHAGLVIAFFLRLRVFGLDIIWLTMCLAIFAVMCITTWPPEFPPTNV